MNQAEQARQAGECVAATSGSGDPVRDGSLSLLSQDDVSPDLLRLVSRGLESYGFSVCLPDQDDGSTRTIDVEDLLCDLTISQDGYIEWDCGGKDNRSADSRQIADLAVLLLTGRAPDHSRQGDQRRIPGTTFKGIVGLEAKARGLHVELKVYGDDDLYDATAEVMVSTPDSLTAGAVRVTDAPGILWEKDFWPETLDDHASYIRRTAESIITSLVPAIPLAQAAFAAAKEPEAPTGQASAGEVLR